MSGIIAAAVAVLGTLLGAVIAHRYQLKTVTLSAAHADRERNHQRLLDACAGFIGLAEDYRRAQYDRWTSQHTAAESEAALAARAESYRLYVEVRSSAFRLRLVALARMRNTSPSRLLRSRRRPGRSSSLPIKPTCSSEARQRSMPAKPS
ncbi:hypothetical protein [Streptomyces sp. NPDC051183]|uniref:hypothetical protein n=1 Tax=unclassified Streptomyces TaxID=2593676 RepID=UPI003431AF8C